MFKIQFNVRSFLVIFKLFSRFISTWFNFLCSFYCSEELWTCLWEQCAGEKIFVEALGEATVRGELYEAAPSPDCSQELIERLASVDPSLVERVVASLPLTSLDPHRASVFTRNKGLWRGVGAIAAALGQWRA